MDCCSMHCCSHGHLFTRRQWIWSTALASVATMLDGGVGPYGSTAAAQTAETASAALEVLRNSISVDIHTHGGATGIVSEAPPNDDLAKGMRAGSLAVACLADVPDAPILKRNEAGVLTAGTPEPGQLYKYHLGRLDWIDELVAHHGLRRALSAADLEAAHSAGDPAIVGDLEGLESAPAWRQARPASPLHSQRHWGFPDRHGYPSGAYFVWRGGDPCVPSARICLRRCTCHRRHREGCR
jgi:hypothetical protein